jgi:hypothetical protein
LLTRLPSLARRRPSTRGARLAASAATACAAVIVGGDVGALLTLAASVLFLHAILPAQSDTWNAADARFRRLQHGRRRSGRRAAAEPLEVLDERTGWAALAQRRDLGVQEIRVDSIRGTAEGSKTATFDGRFRPARSEAERWERLFLAQTHGAALPPVSVYRLGARHYVRDGHHRVSVARELGAVSIEAEVVELVRR